MPEYIDTRYQTYTPAGLVDSIDGGTAKPGGMISLANLMPDQETAGLFICRPAAYTALNFTAAGFSSPGYISCMKQVGNLVYGMIASGLNAGSDQPFVYNTLTSSFLPITNILSTNVPTSPATSGAWTPPTIDAVGGWAIFTHPGFNGTNGTYGWLDFTNFSLTTMTGDTHSSTTVDTLSVNPLIAGVQVGMSITDGSSDIPPGTYITAVTGSGSTGTITLSQAATGSNAVTLSIAGGTTASPRWNSGNANLNPLPSVPTWVSIFYDRAYFACANVLYYTDVLNPLQISNATNSLTLGGQDSVTAMISQPFYTTQTGGIIASLLAMKQAQIWQITGDLTGGGPSTSTLTLNKLSDGVGTNAPRSVVTTPMGTMFVASDGVRTVDLTGNVNPPMPDLHVPFLNPIVPSRIAASYNTGFYRITTNFLQAGVLETNEYWFDTVRQQWTGPNSLTYDCITASYSSFLVAGPLFQGSALQSNVLHNEQTDVFNELGVDMSFVYQTDLVPEPQPMKTLTLGECSIFLGFQLQQALSCAVLDESYNQLGTYTLTTPFYAPSNATNWMLNFVATSSGGVNGQGGGGGGQVVIPTRHQFQISGMSAMNLQLGRINAHYQYQSQSNAFNSVTLAYVYTDLDFGSVTDPILTNQMDWGSVVDGVFATIDFEAHGSHIGPP